MIHRMNAFRAQLERGRYLCKLETQRVIGNTRRVFHEYRVVVWWCRVAHEHDGTTTAIFVHIRALFGRGGSVHALLIHGVGTNSDWAIFVAFFLISHTTSARAHKRICYMSHGT